MTKLHRISDFISTAELKSLSRANNWLASMSVVVNWIIIVFAFLLFIHWPNPLSFIVSICILAGRQLGLAILTHDCAHHTLFSNKSLNNFIGNWLCGAPVNISVYEYRDYHLKHHRFAGTEKDPDRVFVINYPVTKVSLRRKLKRDLIGQTGIRDLVYAVKSTPLSKLMPWIGFHIVLLTILLYIGALWAYPLWWIAALFVLPALMRIRQIGEHGVALDRDANDPRLNTSTTLASWWERLLFAPNYVNFHLEHHQFAAVPGYNLPKLHNLLKTRGYHNGFNCISYGYLDVLRRAVRD